MTFAINWDVHNEAAWAVTRPSMLYAEGFRGVRFTGRASIQHRIDECVAAGLEVMAIITGESAGYVPHNAQWLQFHNEPDLNPDLPDNRAQAVADGYVLFRNTYAEHTDANGVLWASPGFASGGQRAIGYCREFLDYIGDRAPWPDAIAIHPYTLEPGSAQNLIDQFWDAFGIPVIVTEWHHAADTDYIWNFQCMLNGEGLDGRGGRCEAWNSYFCYTDAMVPGFGLKDAQGNPKDEYYALLSSPCNESTPFVPPESDPWEYWDAATIAAATGCPERVIAEHWPTLFRELDRRGIGDYDVQMACIGTTAIETASTFAPVREAFWLSEGWRSQHLRYYPWYGRGFIQLTWEYNYRTYGAATGYDLLSVPDTALEPDPAAAVMAEYFVARGVATAAQQHNWPEVRRRVQGGYAGLDRLTGIVARLQAATAKAA